MVCSSTSTCFSLTTTIISTLRPGEVRKESVRPSTVPTENRDRPWPAATRVRSSRRCTIGRLSGVIGRNPAAHSASSYSPSAGSTAHASSSRSRTPETTGAVSRPCSYWVAPTTTPSARGTKYTCRPCTRARITRCGSGIQPFRQRSRSTSPFTGRTGRPGHRAGASMPLAITTASPSARDRSSTGAAQRIPRRWQSVASASSTARLSTASSVGARKPCRMPCANRGSTSRAADSQTTACPCADNQSATVRRSRDIGPVDGHHQRLARGDHLRRQPVEKPALAPQPQGLDAQPQQPFLARPAFAVRGQHAAGDPRRAVFAGAVHSHGPPGLRRPARYRQSDDAATDNG